MKYLKEGAEKATEKSRPARALWIEIDRQTELPEFIVVEAREGLVD